MKLFQIEEPDGSPVDPDAPGKAIGIDLTGARAEVAVAVGGNAVVLADREEFPLDLTIPAADRTACRLAGFVRGRRLRAERALAQPVTHAVVVALAAPGPARRRALTAAADAAGIECACSSSPPASGEAPALAAAIRAEDLAAATADR